MLKLLALISTVSLLTHCSELQKFDCECTPPSECENPLTDEKSVAECQPPLVCCSYIEVLFRGSAVVKQQQKSCGVRPEEIGFRIYGLESETSEPFEFPWMAFIRDLEEDKYLGGASIIHPQVVMTAAHIVESKNKEKLIVRTGEWDIAQENEIESYQERTVEDVIFHSGYKKKSLVNDLALVILSEPFQLTDNINTVCLPKQNDVILDECHVSGWGKNSSDSDGKLQIVLRKQNVPIIPRSTCTTELKKFLGSWFHLSNSFICAGGEYGKDACTGDGGSPLVCPIPGLDNRYQQVGIVSWGVGCGRSIPGVYVNVAMFRDWIDEKMTTRNFEYSYNY